jgi:hypothetical protein
MNNSMKSMSPAAKLHRKLLLMSIAASSALIVCVVGADLMINGLALGTVSNIMFGLAFWVASGIVSGVALGKMDAVVVIGNTQGRNNVTGSLDNLIIASSCTTIGNQIVQNQIANLWSGIIGVGVVFALCQILSVITGIAMLAAFPGHILAVFPFVIAWKLMEGRSKNAILRRHFSAMTLEATAG